MKKSTDEHLYRCLALTDMIEQSLACRALPVAVRLARESWNYKVLDDFAHADCFNLSGEEREEFIDWMSNQRDFLRLSDSGMDEWDAHHQARADRSQLRKAG